MYVICSGFFHSTDGPWNMVDKMIAVVDTLLRKSAPRLAGVGEGLAFTYTTLLLQCKAVVSPPRTRSNIIMTPKLALVYRDLDLTWT